MARGFLAKPRTSPKQIPHKRTKGTTVSNSSPRDAASARPREQLSQVAATSVSATIHAEAGAEPQSVPGCKLSGLQCAVLAVSLRVHCAVAWLCQPAVSCQPWAARCALLQEKGLCRTEQLAAVDIFAQLGSGTVPGRIRGHSALSAVALDARSDVATRSESSPADALPPIRGIVNRKVSAGLTKYKVRYADGCPDAWLEAQDPRLTSQMLRTFEARRERRQLLVARGAADEPLNGDEGANASVTQKNISPGRGS